MMEIYSVVLGEIQRNIMVLRRNTKWRTQPLQIAQEMPSMMEALRCARRELTPDQVLSEAWIPRIIALFADVVQSPETSGSVTAISLASLRKLLLHGFLNREGLGEAEGMRLVIKAVTHCRFEATNAQRDEIVLSTLLQIQTMLFELPAARYLSDNEVWEIVRTAFRIYDSMKPPEYSDLLQANAITVLQTMITLIFLRLHDSDVQNELSCSRSETGQSSSPISASQERFGSFRRGHVTGSSVRYGLVSMTKVLQHLCLLGHSATAPTVSSESVNQTPRSSVYPKPLMRTSSSEPQSQRRHMQTPATTPVVLEDDSSSAPPTPFPIDSELCMVDSDQSLQPGLAVGSGPLANSLQDTSQQTPDLWNVDLSLSPCTTPSERYGRAVFVCRLLSSVLQAGGSQLTNTQTILGLLQEKVFQFLFDICTWEHPIVLSAALQLFVELVCSIRVQIPLQMELMLTRVYLPGITGLGSFEIKEVILESLADLIHHHWFLPELFANLDCNIEAQNVFALLLNAICKSAFPISGVLTTNHALGLRCLISAFHCMKHTTASPVLEPFHDSLHLKVTRPGPYLAVRSGSELRQAQNYKSILAFCVDEFNRSPTRGLLLLQDRLGLFTTFPRFKSERLQKGKPGRVLTLDEQRDFQEMGRFLRYTPGVDKDQCGQFISTPDVLAYHIRKAYLSHFQFQGLNLPDALRVLVAALGLPKEAQMIDRVLASFAHRFHENNPSLLASEDACHTLTFSLLLLNTDCHNSQIKRKMTLQQFISNNRGINDGDHVPEELLVALYQEITSNELKMTAGTHAHLMEPVWQDYMHVSRRRIRTRPYSCLSSYRQDCKDSTFEILQEAELLTFQAIWRPVLGTLSMAFDWLPEEDVQGQTEKETHDHSPSYAPSAIEGKSQGGVVDHVPEDHLLLTLLSEGFGLICEISRRYGQTQIINRVVGALCKFVLQGSDPRTASKENQTGGLAQSQFASRAKPQFALRLVFSLVVKHKDLLRSGWKDVVASLLLLQQLDLLPPAWLELSDATHAMPHSRKQQLYLSPQQSIEQLKRNSQSGVASLLGFGFLLSESALTAEDSMQAHRAREAMVLCIEPLTAILIQPPKTGQQSEALDVDSLQALVGALLECVVWKGPREHTPVQSPSSPLAGSSTSPRLFYASAPNHFRPTLPNIDPNCLSCILPLEWLNRLVICNPQHLKHIWAQVGPALMDLCEMAAPSPTLFHLYPVTTVQQSLQNSPLALPSSLAEGTAVILLSTLSLFLARQDGVDEAVDILKLVILLDIAQTCVGLQVSEWILNFCQRAAVAKRGPLARAQLSSSIQSDPSHVGLPLATAQGGVDVCQLSQACLQDPRIWQSALVLLARCAADPQLFPSSLKALNLMLGRISDWVISPATISLAQAVLLAFASSSACGSQEALECVDLMLALAAHSASLLTRSSSLAKDLKLFYLHPVGLPGPFETDYTPPFPFSSVSADSSFFPSKAWQTLCLPILTDFRSLCLIFALRPGWDEVFHHAIIALQQLIISDCLPLALSSGAIHKCTPQRPASKIASPSAASAAAKSTVYAECWQSCIAEVIVPLLQDLQPGLVSTRAGSVLPASNSLQQTRTALIDFTSSVLILRLPELRVGRKFHLLWMGYLNLCQAYIRYSKMETGGAVVIETTRKQLKDVVTAMLSAGVFSDAIRSSSALSVGIGRELWDLTWGCLDAEVSQLREEVFPSPFKSEHATKQISPSMVSVISPDTCSRTDASNTVVGTAALASPSTASSLSADFLSPPFEPFPESQQVSSSIPLLPHSAEKAVDIKMVLSASTSLLVTRALEGAQTSQQPDPGTNSPSLSHLSYETSQAANSLSSSWIPFFSQL
eukprot:gb/GEZN01000186.1/.p1 GENE.gb/GEZN01000186.1/~~gb/GEZN01000186.1/.p1  ORF type:complete len:1853 (-),score=239.63 gb/GEZN01000186.1/:367-5925(-)